MSHSATQTSASAAAAEYGTLEVVSFMACGHRCAVEAAQVRTQLPAGQSASSPPPVPAEQLLGLSGEGTQTPQNPESRSRSRRTLLMKHPAGDYAVTVSEPVELHRLEINAIYPLPALIAARCTLAGLRGLAMEPEGVTLLVDFRDAKTPAR